MATMKEIMAMILMAFLLEIVSMIMMVEFDGGNFDANLVDLSL